LVLATEANPRHAGLALAAAQAAMRAQRWELAETHLRRAAALLPGHAIIHNDYAALQIAQGAPREALQTALQGLKIERWNQSLWGLAATAARLAGDPIHDLLCDYERMVGVYDLATPPGWPSLAAFLGDLSAALRTLHGHRREPTSQSVRLGSQTTHLLTGSPDPAIRAAFGAFDAPVRAYLQAMSSGQSPVPARNQGGYRVQGAWSVLLGRGGHHADHLHTEGWISSAFYVEVPDRVAAPGVREGWLRFGAPPIATPTPCPPQRYVQPKPGRLVLFPSYMWHGVEPFESDEQRLTMAFDLVPA
jgi:hypothetical protein